MGKAKTVKTEKLNSGHYLEVMDRCHCQQLMMEELLLSHPVMLKHPELQKDLLAAQKLIGKVYQRLGAMDEETK